MNQFSSEISMMKSISNMKSCMGMCMFFHLTFQKFNKI